MDSDLVDLKDNLIHRLRVSVRSAKKLVDDHAIKIGDQVKIIENAKNDPNIPKEKASDYSQQLQDLFNKGENLLLDFETKNALLLEKLHYLILKFEIDYPDQHDKVESLRNRLVGESLPFKGLFRMKKVEYKHLLSCLFTSQSSASAPTVVAQSMFRKEYVCLKPETIHGDCSKKELLKLIADCKIWLENILLMRTKWTRE